MSHKKLIFPNEKKFAFTILDDTDDATTENVLPIYKYLKSRGIFITKTVWPLSCPEGSRKYFAGSTLADENYFNAVKEIESDGHELAFHCATMETSNRARTRAGLEFLYNHFSSVPTIFCNHGQNRENIYWGKKRFRNPLIRGLYRMLKRDVTFLGDDEHSDFFWGDYHRHYFKFTRNLTFLSELNILKIDPYMPYRDHKKKYANFWFSTSDAPQCADFKKYVTKKKIDELERDGGICILSTHLGKGYFNKNIDPYFSEIIDYLSEKKGWFVPTSQILEFLLNNNQNKKEIGFYSLSKLEAKYLMNFLLNRFVGG